MTSTTTSGGQQPQTRRGIQRRDAILQVAEEKFLAHGMHDVSLDTVVEAVGGSKATIYQYFGSKQGLLDAMIARRCERFFAEMNFSDTLPDQPLYEVLLERTRRLYQAFTAPDNVAFSRLIMNESQRDSTLAQQAYERGIGRGIRQVASLLEQAHQRGEIVCSEPMMSAAMLVSIIRHSQWRLLVGLPPFESSYEPDRFFEYTISQFIRGMQ